MPPRAYPTAQRSGSMGPLAKFWWCADPRSALPVKTTLLDAAGDIAAAETKEEPIMGVRIAEVMAALSLTTDLATGLRSRRLRVCIVADELVKRLPDRVTDDGRLRATTYQATPALHRLHITSARERRGVRR